MSNNHREFTDDTDPEEYAEYVEPYMDVREIIGVMCDLHEDSRVPKEVAVKVAVLSGREREQVMRTVSEYISLVEVVEVDNGYVQTRRHFDEGFK
jgi:hypothetical protein